MSEIPEINVQWISFVDEELEVNTLRRASIIDENPDVEKENDGPEKDFYVKKQLHWAKLRRAQATPGSFDADFLSGIIAASLDNVVERREILSGFCTGDGDDIVASNWFVSGYVSTKALFNLGDFSRLRFTADVGDEITAVMREKYRVN